MTEPTSREILNYQRPVAGDFGPLVRQIRCEGTQTWGFYVLGLAIFILGLVGAIYNSALAAAIMVPVGFPVREIALCLGAVIGMAIAIVGWNHAHAVADIHERGVRFRSLFKSLDISLEGIANIRWNSKDGTVFQYRNGGRLKTGQLLSQEIYNQILTLTHSPSPQAQVKQRSDIGNIIMLFKADRGWLKSAAVGFSLFPVLFLLIVLKTSPASEPNPSRIGVLVCIPLIALFFFYLAYLDESRLITLYEAGIDYRTGGQKKWSCQYSEIARLSTTATTQTTKFLGALPVGQSTFISGITLHLKDGRILKAAGIAQMPLAAQMIQSKLQPSP
jgi:hypothetical protein